MIQLFHQHHTLLRSCASIALLTFSTMIVAPTVEALESISDAKAKPFTTTPTAKQQGVPLINRIEQRLTDLSQRQDLQTQERFWGLYSVSVDQGGLVDDLIDVGNKLKQTQKSYEASMNKLSTGKGSLVKKAQDLKELGIKTKKDLPKNIIDRTELEN